MKYIRSPINYTGSKYKLLDKIIPMFPNNINTFLDVFGGSGTITLNVQANNKIYNELNENLFGMFSLFKDMKDEEIINHIIHRINEFGLGKYIYPKNLKSTDNALNNEKFKEGYISFKDYFNQEDKGITKSLDLLTIHYFSFNNLIRFTSKPPYKFNAPVGIRVFLTDKHSELIKNACDKSKNISLTNYDFRNVDYSILTSLDFVYLDPPYYISSAEYNKLWTEKEEMDLYNICDDLTKRNIKWAMSNMIMNNNIEHTLLKEWCLKNNYSMHYINTKYSGWTGNKLISYKGSQEVLITNY